MKISQLLALSLLLTGISCRRSGQETENVQIRILHVRTEIALQKDMVDTIGIFGEVSLREEAMLASQFDGRLENFSLLLGDRIEKGEKVGIVVPPLREALLQVMDSIDESQREMLAREINAIPLFSPISGVVLQVSRHTGDVVQKGEAIARIGNLDHLDVHGDLPLQYLGYFRALDRIRVSFVSFPHEPLFLPVDAIAGEVKKTSQSIPVRLDLDNPLNEFRPGMMVRLTFPGQIHRDATVVPRSAILEEEGIMSVFTVHEGKAEKRTVIPGIMQKNYAEVLSGLQPGEPVVVRNTYSLTDGMEVIAE